jgi:outer membrane protein
MKIMQRVAVSVLMGVMTLGLAQPASAVDGGTVYVNLNKVFDEFYKTKLADAQLKEQADQYKEERTKLVDDFKKLQDDFKAARDEAQNTALNEEARNTRRTEAEEKLVELREMENKIRRFEESRRRQLDEQTRRVRTKLVDEIKEVLAKLAREKGYGAVIDASGENLNGVSTILYYDSKADITDLLVDLLNKGKS